MANRGQSFVVTTGIVMFCGYLLAGLGGAAVATGGVLLVVLVRQPRTMTVSMTMITQPGTSPIAGLAVPVRMQQWVCIGAFRSGEFAPLAVNPTPRVIVSDLSDRPAVTLPAAFRSNPSRPARATLRAGRVFAMQSALDNLDLSIREKQYLLSSYQADIAATLKNITDDMVGQVSAIREAQKTYTSSAEVAEFKKTFGEDYPAAINKAIARLRIWELMTGQTNLASFAGMVFGVLGSRAGGGYIPETGPYLLHEGETVVPSNTSYGGDTYITMHVNVSQKLTSSELRSLLASASNDRVIGRGAKTRTRTR